MPDLTFASLYSGCGGLDLGLARAGLRPAWADDIDFDACNTYDRIQALVDPEWIQAAGLFTGHCAHRGDIAQMQYCLPQPGEVDVVAGGPPCQGFSVAGKMDPADPRARHVHVFMEAVGRLRPRAFIMENVAHLARSPRWHDVMSSLRKAAWASDYRTLLVVLDAADYGVPQHRHRMFFIGLGPDIAMDLTELHHLLELVKLHSPAWVPAGEALRRLPTAGDPGNSQLCIARITLARKPVLRQSPFAGMLFNGAGRPMDLNFPAPTLPATMGGNRTPVIDLDQLHYGTEPWVVTYHSWLTVECQQPLAEVPDFARMRRLTVEEAAALQSFPRDMPWQGPQTSRFRQVGNAVPPRLAWAVGQAVVAALTSKAPSSTG